MSKCFKCDRCGNAYTVSRFKQYPKYILSERGERKKDSGYYYDYIDLCPSCFSLLEEFLGDEEGELLE